MEMKQAPAAWRHYPSPDGGDSNTLNALHFNGTLASALELQKIMGFGDHSLHESHVQKGYWFIMNKVYTVNPGDFIICDDIGGQILNRTNFLQEVRRRFPFLGRNWIRDFPQISVAFSIKVD